MNALQVTPEYIRNEKDFLTPLPLGTRFLRMVRPQTLSEQMAYPLNWVPGIDISGIGQTKAIAAAFPELFAAGWKLVIMRASIGLVADSLFNYFWKAALDAGMYVMTYHLGLSAYSGSAQALVYLRAIDPMLTRVDGHSAAALDVEVLGEINAWRNTVTSFHSAVRSKLISGCYSSVAKWKSCTNNMTVPGFAWNASWSNLSDVPSFGLPMQTVLRQVGVYLKHAWVPKPPGVKEDVDVNYFMGTERQLRNFLGYDDLPPPPPPPSDLEAKVDALIAINYTEHKKMQEDIGDLALVNHTEHKKMQDDMANLVARVDALVEGGVPATKPRFQIGGSLANCRVVIGVNSPTPPATAKPIMGIPPMGPHRIQFDAGTIVLLASDEKVDADGSIWYYQVDPSQYPSGEPAQYLRSIDGVLLPD